jgi:hypothetical protein
MVTSLGFTALALCAIPALVLVHAITEFRSGSMAAFARRDSLFYLGGVELLAVPFLILLAIQTDAPAAAAHLLH